VPCLPRGTALHTFQVQVTATCARRHPRAPTLPMGLTTAVLSSCPWALVCDLHRSPCPSSCHSSLFQAAPKMPSSGPTESEGVLPNRTPALPGRARSPLRPHSSPRSADSSTGDKSHASESAIHHCILGCRRPHKFGGWGERRVWEKGEVD
jgi:hypothetical protein